MRETMQALVRGLNPGSTFSSAMQASENLASTTSTSPAMHVGPAASELRQTSNPILPAAPAQAKPRLCLACYEHPPDVVLVDCGHMVLCMACVRQLTSYVCPCCRKPIDHTPVKVFQG